MALPRLSPSYVKGVFPLTTTTFCAFNSPSEWLQAILDNDSTRLNKCFIEQVVHYKRTDGKEHEFLMLHVGLIDSPQKACIIAERDVQTPNKADRLAVSSNSAPFPFSSSSSSSRGLPADDSIRCAYLASEGYQQLARHQRLQSGCIAIQNLTFDAVYATPPSILEVATLIKAISSHAPSYSLFRNQCYWFAATVMKALTELFPTPVKLRSIEPHKGGTCKGVNVPMANSVSRVCDEYRMALSAVDSHFAEAERRREEAMWSRIMHQADTDKARAKERAALERERAVLDARERELAGCAETLKALQLALWYG